MTPPAFFPPLRRAALGRLVAEVHDGIDVAVARYLRTRALAAVVSNPLGRGAEGFFGADTADLGGVG